MNTEDFLNLLEGTHNTMLKTSASKGQEYAGSDDRLANFKRLADQLGLIPEQVLWVYFTKHLDSLNTWIKDQAAGRKRNYSEPITGRVNDAILYLNLLKGLMCDRDENLGQAVRDEIPVLPSKPPAHTPPMGYSCRLTIHEHQTMIAEWADSVFPDRTAHGSLSKLVLEEIPEFIMSGMNDPHEYADLIILILDIAHLRGINVDMAVVEKMIINRNRTWVKNKETGFLNHAEAPSVQES